MKSGYAQAFETEPSHADIQEHDRRRSGRQPIQVVGWVSAEAGTRGSNRHVDVSDFSLNGVGFVSDSQYERDAIHWIIVGGQSGGLRASSRMRIAFCRERTDSKFECGAEFF